MITRGRWPNLTAPFRPGGFWPLSVHINVLDVASAVAAAVRCATPPHVRLLLCAADIASARPTLDLIAERVAHVRWCGGEAYRTDRYRSLVDTSKAQRLLDWQPKYTWPGRLPEMQSLDQRCMSMKR